MTQGRDIAFDLAGQYCVAAGPASQFITECPKEEPEHPKKPGLDLALAVER